MALITPTDLYDEGLSEDDYPAPLMQGRISVCQRIIETITGKWFEPRQITFKLDGDGTDEIRMPAPIISVSAVQFKNMSNQWETINAGNYEVSNNLPYDWQDPSIVIQSFRNTDGDISFEWSTFPSGRRNIQVTGYFGWCINTSGDAPEDIIMAAKVLTDAIKGSAVNDQMKESFDSAFTKREDYEDHEWEQSVGFGQLTGITFVDLILQNYTGSKYGDSSTSLVV